MERSREGLVKIYLAARYRRFIELQGYAARLEDLGRLTTSCWIPSIRRGVLTGIPADLREADAIVAFTEKTPAPIRGGRHVEYCIAIRMGKDLFVVGPLENLFYLVAEAAQFIDFDHFIEWSAGR